MKTDTAEELVLWVGAQSSPAFLSSLFGTETPADGAQLLAAAANGEARKLHALLASMREGRPAPPPPLRVVVQGSAEQGRFFGRLLADGYEPFVLQLHTERVSPKL